MYVCIKKHYNTKNLCSFDYFTISEMARLTFYGALILNDINPNPLGLKYPYNIVVRICQANFPFILHICFDNPESPNKKPIPQAPIIPHTQVFEIVKHNLI